MKITIWNWWRVRVPSIPNQTMLAMKLTVILSFVAFLQFSYAGTAQNVSFNCKNKRLEDVFKELKKQTGYSFFYSNQDISGVQSVTVNIQNEPLEHALAEILKDRPLTFSINSKTVFIKDKPFTPALVPPSGLASAMVAADITIKGKVLADDNKAILGGATVKIKGTEKATMTDNNGMFAIHVPEKGAVLQISYVGYETIEVAVGKANTDVVVMLKPKGSKAEEIVVVAYGTQKRSQVIGATAQVTGDEITKAGASPLLSQGLAGRLSGVSIMQSSGQPGLAGAPTINIRGVGSFGASTAPLILVDGLQTTQYNNIDPNDIESVTVLKDASTAAMYGAQAANGVMLITTKSGKNKDGKIGVSYNGSIAIEKITRTPSFEPSWQYATLLNEAVQNTTPGAPAAYTPAQIDSFKSGNNPYLYPNTNWVASFFKKSAIQNSHNITISNGNKTSQYNLSLGYMGQDGLVPKNNFNRFNARFNLISQLAKKLTLTTRLSGYQTINNEPQYPAGAANSGMNTMILYTIRTNPTIPIYNQDGSWNASFENAGTPVSSLYSDSYFKDKIINYEGSLRLDWEAIAGLKISAIAGYNESNELQTNFMASQQVKPTNMASVINLGPSTLSQTSNNNNYKTLQFLVNYHKRINKHEFDLLAGHSYEANNSFSMNAGTNTFISNDVIGLGLGLTTNPTVGQSQSQSALDSYLGRVLYNFANKYLVQGTVRYDGSSRFGPSYKYGTFPSVAVGWRIAQENFIKDNYPWIDELKLKASYGVLGNQNIGNYPYQSTLTQGSTGSTAGAGAAGHGYVAGGVYQGGIVLGAINNADLHWESTRTKDAGIEASFLKGLIGFGINYYDKYTFDILTSPGGSVSQVFGFTVGTQNSGALNNHGWEFTLSHVNRVGNVNYSISANLTTVKNTVLDLGAGNNTLQNSGYIGSGGKFIGQPLQSYYGYVASGLYRDSADLKNWQATNNTKAIQATGTQPNAVGPGDIKYKDVGGAYGGPKDSTVTTADLRILGNNIPKYSYGINLTAAYKNFDIAVLLQGIAGVSGYLSSYAGFAFNNSGNIQTWQADGRWTADNPNPNAIYPRIQTISNSGNGNTITSSFWVVNGSYFRVKSLQLGYTLPGNALKKMGMQSLRLNASAYNLLTVSHYRKGWDPEILNTGGSYYPILGSYSFGLNVTF